MIGAVLALLAVAQQSDAAAAPSQAFGIQLHSGDLIPLATIAEVSTRTAAVGDRVPMAVSEDVRVGGRVVIPAGTPAMGEVAAMQAKGAFGQSGKLTIRPLYVTLGDRTLRLEGGGGAHGTITAGGVIGLIALTPGISGRSATVPAGAPIPAVLLRDVAL